MKRYEPSKCLLIDPVPGGWTAGARIGARVEYVYQQLVAPLHARQRDGAEVAVFESADVAIAAATKLYAKLEKQFPRGN